MTAPIVTTTAGYCFNVLDVALTYPIDDGEDIAVLVTLVSGVRLVVPAPLWVTDRLDADLMRSWAEVAARMLIDWSWLARQDLVTPIVSMTTETEWRPEWRPTLLDRIFAMIDRR